MARATRGRRFVAAALTVWAFAGLAACSSSDQSSDGVGVNATAPAGSDETPSTAKLYASALARHEQDFVSIANIDKMVHDKATAKTLSTAIQIAAGVIAQDLKAVPSVPTDDVSALVDSTIGAADAARVAASQAVSDCSTGTQNECFESAAKAYNLFEALQREYDAWSPYM
jgi:hypothetical protein